MKTEEVNIVSIENSMSPAFSNGKLFYFTIEEAPVRNRRYFFTQNREIENFVTTGISLFSYDLIVTTFPQIVELEGTVYNTIFSSDVPKISVTWYNQQRKWIEYHKPLSSFLEFPFFNGNVLCDTRLYNYRIVPPISYYQFNTVPLLTPFPIVMPFMFYW